MKAHKRAYLAGIIDGEGCIDAFTINGRNWIIRVRVSQNHFPEIPDWLHKNFGGTRRVTKHGINHSWYVAGLPAAKVIQAAYPYMIGPKVAQAVVAIEIYNQRNEDCSALNKRLKELKYATCSPLRDSK